jgi:phosphoglucosamine mutase
MALFGTDGIRGEANTELTPELALEVGAAAGSMLGPGARVVIGRDTRVSGPMLEKAAVAGLTSAGVETVSLGVAPTPAVAALVPLLDADAGLVISASHNPPEYNGLKLLDRQGRKWDQSAEALVEERIRTGDRHRAAPTETGAARDWPEALERYREHLVGRFAGRVPKGLKVVLDLGHGAAVTTAAEILERLGVETVVLYGEPHGLLINQGCGATNPDVVAAAVRRHHADAGLSFDGDADRLMAADASGRILDGDALLYLLALDLHERNELPGSQVVATVMSNLGLERALGTRHITLVRTDVGDRWVAEEMHRLGAVLGGEQSGHIIQARHAVTGDGLLTALSFLSLLTDPDTVADRLGELTSYPQLLVNLPVPRAHLPWNTMPGLVEAVADCERDLGDEGRCLVRASGTEPLLRIMLEGRNETQIQSWADRLTAVVQTALEPETAPSMD